MTPRDTQPPRVLVTGASGFLGEHLARRLVARGARVVGTWHGNPVDIPGVDCIPVDLADSPAVARLVRDLRPDTIHHCAALTDTGACERDPAAARASIVDATAALVAALATHQPACRLVAVSTDLVFDGTAAPYSPGAPTKPLMTYGSLKLEGEGAALAHPNSCVVRAALMYGPPTTHRASFLGWMREALAAGRPLTLFHDEFRTPVCVDDLAAAMESLADAHARGAWHAGGPERLDRLAMGRLVCEVFGFDPALLVSASLAEWSRTNAGAPRPADVSLDSTRTWQTVGRAPKDFRHGLEWTKSLLPSPSAR